MTLTTRGLIMSKAFRRYRKVKPIRPRFVYVSHEDFRVERITAGFTRYQAADYLGVNVRTIRNWETGATRIPYPAFRLLRMRAKGLVYGQGWEGWRFTSEGALCSPVGRSYTPNQLLDLSHVFRMANLFASAYGKQRDIERGAHV